MMQYEAVARREHEHPVRVVDGSGRAGDALGTHDVLTEMQDFLADHEDLFSTSTFSETAVAYSVPSAFEHQMVDDARSFAPFYEACDALVAQAQPFDVVMFPEGELRPDTLTLEDLAQYRTLVLPNCTFLTPEQVELVEGFLGRRARARAGRARREPGRGRPRGAARAPS